MIQTSSNSRQWGLSTIVFLLSFFGLTVLNTQSAQAQLNIVADVTHVTCNGLCNGVIDLTITGGVGPYEVLWLGSSNSGLTESGLCEGSHAYSVSDLGDPASGPVFQQVSVIEPDVLVGFFVNTAIPSCDGLCDGSATLEIVGGTEPYNFSWPAGATVSADGLSATGLCPGPLVIPITDANSCSTAASSQLDFPDPIVLATTTSENATCAGNDGSASVTASGGNGPYDYLWSDGQMGTMASGLAPGDYTVEITDMTNCMATAMVTIGGSTNTMMVSLDQTTNITCFGSQDGTGTASVSGGTPPFTYAWSSGTGDGSTSNTSTATGLIPGPGSVTITDANSCEETLMFDIIEPPVLVLSIDATTDVSCPLDGNGTVTASATGGSGSYIFTYTDAVSGADVTAQATSNTLPGGDYIATVTDSMNPSCTDSIPFSIVEPTPITGMVDNATDPTCFGAIDGTITVSASGGTGSLNYAWSPSGGNAATASGLAAGTYTVTITDDAGCSIELTETLIAPTEIIAVIDPPTNIACFGETNGTATVVVTGGSGNFDYSWSPSGATTATATGLGSGLHTVTVSEQGNPSCFVTDDVTIFEPNLLEASATTTDVSCFGLSDGTATLTISGGNVTTPYTEDWQGVDPNALAAGNYDVIVTDASNCSLTVNVVINEPTEIMASVVPTDVSCFGGSDGSATATITGGTPPYVENWNGADPLALIAGSYILTVTDANMCSVDVDVVIAEPAEFSVTIVATDALCFGQSTGTAVPTIVGGTGPFTEDYGNGITSGTALPAGNYTLTVTDANFCTATTTLDIFEPVELTGSVATSNVSCFGLSDGTAVGAISGGTEPYTLNYGGDENALAAGTYTLQVTDANGCTLDLPFDILQPDEIVVTPTTTDVSCFGGSDGTATLTITGGTPTFTENWNGADPSALAVGTYPVTITDLNGCSVDIDVVINEPSEFSVTVVTTDVLCFGESTGDVVPTIVGGTGPFTEDYGVPGYVAGQCPAGNYTLIVTDANGCTAMVDFEILEPTELTGSVVTTDVTCFGLSDGTVAATITGGTPPYTEDYGGDQNALVAGMYTLTVTDANGCSLNLPFDILQPDEIIVTPTTTDVSCFDGTDGTATLTITGGTPPFTENWNGADPATLPGGTYPVTVMDANGCTVDIDVIINEPAEFSVTVATTDALCFGESTGIATPTIVGGTGIVTEDYGVGNVGTALAAGPYTLTVTDENGCTASTDFEIFEGPELSATVATTDVSCFGLADGTAEATITGGTAPYTENFGGDQNALVAGSYTLQIVDTNGCTFDVPFDITEPNAINLTVTPTNVGCFGESTGSAFAEATGGNGMFTYTFTDATGTDVDETALSAGNYTVTATDASGCSFTEDFVIEEGAEIVLQTNVIQNVSCAEAQDGQVEVTVTGTTALIVSTEWTDATGGPVNPDALAGGDYNVLVTDENNCTAIGTVTVTEPAPLVGDCTSTEISGAGQTDGSVAVSVTGGEGTYAYVWDGLPNDTPTIENLGPGSYMVTVTDGNNCSIQIVCEILDADCVPFTILIDTVDVLCYGDANGSATATVTGGDGNYTFEWLDNPSTTDQAENYAAGSYTVMVTDGAGCTGIETFDIAEPAELFWAIDCDITPVSAPGLTDASITVEASGGTGVITYAWDNGQTTATATGLGAGPHTVIATDENNCSITTTCTIQDLNCDPITLTITPSDLLCFGDTNGSAIVDVMGGVGPYTYEWSADATVDAAEIMGLSAGPITVTVTDSQNCSETASSEILEPAELIWAIECDITPVSAPGQTDASISVEAIGGTGNIDYVWDNGQTTATATGLGAGSHTVTVTDENNCSITTTCTIQDLDCDPITLTINPVDALCFGDTNGSATVEVVGGTAPYMYEWSTNDSGTEEVTGLSAGPISIIVTDSQGCSQTASSDIFEPALLEFVGACDVTPVSSAVSNDGEITISAIGGTGNLTYDWTPDVSTSENATGLAPGSYTVLVTDENNCTIEQTCTVPSTDCDVFTLSAVENAETCFDAADGSINITIDGGLPPFNYDWTPTTAMISGSNPTGLAPGTYDVVVTSSDNCTQTASYEILAADEFIAEAIATQLNCDGTGQNGITVAVTGGNGPGFVYSWTPNVSSTDSASDLDPGTYTIEVTDDSNCVSTTTAIINDSAIPTATFTAAPQLCDSENLELDIMAFGQGSIVLEFTINGDPYTVPNLSNGLGFTQAYPLSTLDTSSGQLDIEMVSVTADGCLNDMVNESLSVIVVSAIELEALPVETCSTDNMTFTVEFEISGGDAATYSVDPAGSGTLSTSAPYIFTSNPITSGDSYSFNVMDNSGCAAITVDGSFDCNCETVVGTIDLTPIEICDDQQAMVTILTDPVSDGDDAQIFVLHDNSGASIGDAIQFSADGVFAFTPPMVHNTTYYISMVIGNEDTTTGVDLADPCLDVSPGVPVTFFPFPVAQPGPNDATCSNEYQLQALLDTGATGTWEIIDDGGINLTISDLNDPSALATVDNFGTVELAWTSAMGDCSDTANIIIEFLEVITTTVEPTAVVCNTTDGGSTIELSDLVLSGVSTGTWTDVASSGASATGTTYDFNGLSAGTYTFNYQTPNSGGCPSESFDVEITINDCTSTLVCPTVLTIAEGTEAICEGDSVDLSVYESSITIDDPDGTFDGIEWFADDAHTTLISATFAPQYTGSCDPQIITAYPGVLCDLSGTVLSGGAIEITVYPIATGELELSTSGCQLTAQLDCPNFSFEGTGLYQTIPEDFEEITLEIFNEDAVSAGLEPCGNTISNSFNCDELIKFITLPNAFSPDGDGMNDFFHPLLMTGVSDVRLAVFNRWGQKVFSTEDMFHQGWDGKFNGVDQEIGVYAYIMSATFFDGKQKVLKGNVTLIR